MPPDTDSTDIKQLLAEDRLEEGLVIAASRLTVELDNSEFLTTSREIFRRTGFVTLELEAVRALRDLTDSAPLQDHERRLIGRLRDSDTDWLPMVQESLEISSGRGDRVLHLLKLSGPYRQSGYTMRSQYLIDGQRASGFDPVAVTALGFPDSAGVDTYPLMEVINSTPYYRLPRAGLDLARGPFDEYLDEYATEAAALVAALGPSLIHVHSGHRGYEAALVGLALARRFDLPLVYEVRGFFESLWSPDPEWNEKGEMYWRRHAAETRCMTEAHAVVTLSNTMREEIIRRGVDRDKVFIVPNGVDPERFFPSPRDPGLVRALDLEEHFVFGYVSNLDHYREGQELLIDAVAHVAEMGIPAKVMIIGDGRRRKELEELAEIRGVADRVIFTGQVAHDQVLPYYRLLDVFVVPRVAERAARLVSPLKPFEAMAAGVPLVVSDLASLSELVGTTRGLTFPSGNTRALADTLAALWSDPQQRSKLAEAARSWVLAERRWSKLAERYEEVYRIAHAALRTG